MVAIRSMSIVVLAGLMAGLVSAQEPPSSSQKPARLPGAISVDEATELTNGWALLAQGHVQEAAARAAKVLTAYTRSAAALILAVEAEIARGAAAAGLTLYERWLGARTMEETGVLRRIAQAALREDAAQREHAGVRLEAMRALAADGEAAAQGELASAAYKGGYSETRTLASLGDERAVNILIAELNKGTADKVTSIDALGESRSKLAIKPLLDHVKDPRPEVRAAVALALAKAGGWDYAEPIRSMLMDESSFVRARAAGALYQLGDDSGLPLLEELARQESAAGRSIAATLMAGRPTQEWQALVRSLTSADEPEVRIQAARLIAPHDPELANRVLEELAGHGNPAIRELASRTLSEAAAGDLTSLRKLLRHGDRLTRVRAAGRILALTR
jgi:HEAT repeat protein